jgi:LCP family protein required for cell wall assembly
LQALLGAAVGEPFPSRLVGVGGGAAYHGRDMAVQPASGGGRRAESSVKGDLGALAGRSERRWPRRVLVSANVTVLALLALGVSAYGYVQWRFSQVARVTVHGLTPTGRDSQSPPVPGGPPMTFLLVGSDTRALGKGASAAFGTAQEVSGQRSDTIVLMRVVPATSSVALLSVPRDLLVDVPGMGVTRINAAFDGGPDLLVKTIQQDLGIDINHFVVVNFATFTKIADALGGVYQYFPTPARDLYSNLVVPRAGCVLLKGAQALAFVRSREYQYYLDGAWQYQLVPESDLARIQRQQDFIKLALKKAEEIGPTDPLALNRVISGITSSLTVDSTFSSSLMLRLALVLRHTHVSAIPNWTYPNVNSLAVPGALDPVPSEDDQVTEEFLNYGMPTIAPTSAAKVAPSSVSVDVLNGSGITGQAARAAAALRSEGFRVTATGDAGSYSYAQSVVEYGNGGLAAARLLESKVAGGAQLKVESSLSGEHLVLITGQSFAVPAGQSAAPPGDHGPIVTRAHLALAVSTAVTAPVQPDSSSYWHGQYIPPGLQPGQVPKTCPA